MSKTTKSLRCWSKGLLCLMLLLAPLGAAKKGSSENSGPDLKSFFGDLKEAKDVVSHLNGLESWSAEELGHKKLEGVLLGLLSDERLLKSEKTKVLEVVTNLAMYKGVVGHDTLAKKLLTLFPKITSPTFQRDAFMTMGELDDVQNGTTVREISSLVGKIISDAAAPKKDQEYSASLHAESLSIFDASKVTKSQLETLSNLLKANETLSPVLLKGVYQAIMNLAIESPKAFNKREKTIFLKTLLGQIKDAPGKMGRSASENEIEVLVAAIEAVGPLIGSEDTLSQLDDGTKMMTDLFLNEEDRIFQSASKVLLAITKADLPRSKLKLDEQLLPELEKANKKNPKSQRVRDLLEIAIELEGYLLKGNLKDSSGRLANMLSVFHKTVLTHPDIGVREKALDGFFVLEPKFFKGKILNKDAKATLKKFVTDCVGVMGNKDMRKALPGLLESMGAVLFEMTGQDYGSDAKLWGEWLRNEGSDLF
jgi:hypothetical protein